MEQRTAPIQEAQGRPQELFIDGLKVTVRYGSGSNQAAVKKIREILLTGGVLKKKS